MSFALNRRTFLKSASGVLLGLAYLPGSARAGASNAGTVASSASWDDLARSLKGPLLHKRSRLRHDRRALELALRRDAARRHRPLRFA